ncbi:unnamed protein product [Paramecium sonneborni]|uniref:Uncharacterized protein n=1 Tax=Paramecium sonneborni TaxID=65129 RepID=A0A8S1KAY5_9CILI|nr:unnamed protein product [Paramecium sonneborni]
MNLKIANNILLNISRILLELISNIYLKEQNTCHTIVRVIYETIMINSTTNKDLFIIQNPYQINIIIFIKCRPLEYLFIKSYNLHGIERIQEILVQQLNCESRHLIKKQLNVFA